MRLRAAAIGRSSPAASPRLPGAHPPGHDELRRLAEFSSISPLRCGVHSGRADGASLHPAFPGGPRLFTSDSAIILPAMVTLGQLAISSRPPLGTVQVTSYRIPAFRPDQGDGDIGWGDVAGTGVSRASARDYRIQWSGHPRRRGLQGSPLWTRALPYPPVLRQPWIASSGAVSGGTSLRCRPGRHQAVSLTNDKDSRGVAWLLTAPGSGCPIRAPVPYWLRCLVECCEGGPPAATTPAEASYEPPTSMRAFSVAAVCRCTSLWSYPFVPSRGGSRG